MPYMLLVNNQTAASVHATMREAQEHASVWNDMGDTTRIYEYVLVELTEPRSYVKKRKRPITARREPRQQSLKEKTK